MFAIKVAISGSASVVSGLRSKILQHRDKVNDAIQGAGIDTEAGAKQLCPVDTGRLRSSISYHPGDLSCTVDSNVKYALFVELGTRWMPARPFLYPPFSRAVANLRDELKRL